MNIRSEMCNILLFVFLISTFQQFAAGSDDVPMCCPDGQQVLDSGANQLECINSLLFKDLKPLNDLPKHHHQLKCQQIEHETIKYRKKNNLANYIQNSMMIYEEFDSYCFDFSHLSDERFYVHYCSEQQPSTVNWTYTVCCGISIVLLVITSLMYATNKQLKANPHSPYIVSHNLAVAMAYVFRISRQFVEVGDDLPACEFVGFGTQLFTLAAFFWMNSMCIDVYLSLWSMRPSSDRKMRLIGKKFAALSFYAWGVPLLITALTITLEYQDFVPESSMFKPNLGMSGYSCFFKDHAKWIYFRGPLVVTVVINITLFTLTALKLIRHRKTVTTCSPNSRFNNEKKFFALYLKLFVIMGLCWSVTWVFDSIVKVILRYVGRESLPGPMQFLYVIVDLVFGFQGVFIFILFLCNKRTSRILFGASRPVSCLSSQTEETGYGSDKNTPYAMKNTDTPMI